MNAVVDQARGFGGGGPARARWQPRVGRVIDSARARRSRFVGAMRVALPLLALAVVVLVAIWPQFGRRQEGFRLLFSQLNVAQEALTMSNARYRGTDSRNQPFSITAETATQDPRNAKLIALDKLTADMTLEDGSWLSMSADSGLYEQDAQRLTLQGNVNIFSDRGYEFHALTAEIDLAAGSVASDERVWGQGPLGLLRANGLRVFDKGARIRFIEGVHTTLFPDAQG